MNYITQHLKAIIELYDGGVPLSIFLKSYYKEHPKLGSRDRKAITEGVYVYYRSVLFLDPDLTVLEVLQQGYFLCKSANVYLGVKLDLDMENKPEIAAYAPHLGVPLSGEVDENAWLKSHWTQPDVYIRIIQNQGLVFELLEQNNITYTLHEFPSNYGAEYTCISVPNSAPIDKILFPEDYIIQDRSSQLVLLIAAKHWRTAAPKYFWDVCSGAGGKTLLLKQLDANYHITASDIRKTILHNLKGRCLNYGISDIVTKQIDATDAEDIAKHLGKKKYDVILCDVPCSGSGTWSRTPEQLYIFNAAYFDQFAHLQYPIAANTIPYLKVGGVLVYITCSVMQHENEAVVNRLLEHHSDITLIEQQMISGVEHAADTLFVAVFKKIQ